MFEATVDINAKDYNACTLYYLKKFVGVKEYILVGFLLIGGLVLFFAFNQWLILALCGVTVLLMAAAIVVYIALARKGYREEFVKRNNARMEIHLFRRRIHRGNARRERRKALYGEILLR